MKKNTYMLHENDKLLSSVLLGFLKQKMLTETTKTQAGDVRLWWQKMLEDVLSWTKQCFLQLVYSCLIPPRNHMHTLPLSSFYLDNCVFIKAGKALILTWQRQLCSDFPDSEAPLRCGGGLSSWCWNQPKTKLPKSQATRETVNTCNVILHITHCTVGNGGQTKQKGKKPSGT